MIYSMLYKKLGGYGMEDTTKVDAESTMPEADSEEAVSEVDKKVKVPKSKRFGKKESAKQPVKDKLKASSLSASGIVDSASTFVVSSIP